jgi:hypothetical protein
VVRRSSLLTKSQPNFPLTQVEIRWRAFRRLDLQDVAVLRPDIEAAPTPQYVHTVLVRRMRVSRMAGFDLGDFHDRSVAGLRLNALDHVDHAVERRFRQAGDEAGVTEHGFFHQRIAGTDRHAVAARNAARFADGRAAVPQHARVRILPVDGQRFVDLDVLAGLHAAAAENALVGIVAVERIGVIDFVGLGYERDSLVLDGQQLRGVVDRAIAVVVVADRAVEHVVAEDAIKCLRCAAAALRGLGEDLHASSTYLSVVDYVDLILFPAEMTTHERGNL